MIGWIGESALNGWDKHAAPGQAGLHAAGGLQP